MRTCVSSSSTATEAPANTSARLVPWLERRARDHVSQPVLVGRSLEGVTEQMTFELLLRRSAALALGLLNLGLRRGDAMAIWLPSRPLWLLMHFAAARAGLLTIPLNTWYRESEIAHFLRLARCRAIVLGAPFLGIDFDRILMATLEVQRAHDDLRLDWIIDAHVGSTPHACAGTPRRVGLAELERQTEPRNAPAELTENRAMIAYPTSGTTSAPKLAVHREAALIAHATAVAHRAAITPRDVVLSVLPPCGAYGYGLVLAALAGGARATLLEQFDLDHTVRLIADDGVTILAVTEPLLRKLLDHPAASRENFRSLRLVFSAGSTLEQVVRRAEAEFGIPVSNVYGSSEILALAAFWDFDSDTATRAAAGGRLVSDGMRVRAVGLDGAPVARGAEGELQFRGPIVTTKYLANRAATIETFTDDGWLSSQDLGVVLDDEGTLFHYISRMNDALRVKGFLVSPSEIEAMLQTHSAVAAAQVVGVPDGQGEDAAAAFVVLHAGCSVRAEELREHCHSRMASYKVPAVLEIVDAFPMTRSANGDKVQKSRLRERAKEILRG